MIQTVSIVVDVAKNSQQFSDWSLSKIFGVETISKCPFAEKSHIEISKDVGVSLDFVDIAPKFEDKGQNHFLKLVKGPYDVKLSWKKKKNLDYRSDSLVDISTVRYEKSFGLQGVITTRIKNQSKKNITVSFFDAIPWYFRVYFSTMKFKVNDVPVSNFPIKFKEAREKVTPYEFEFVYVIPGESHLEMTIEFDKIFLQISDHSPDAHRGFDLSSPIVMWGDFNGKFDWNQTGKENSTIWRYYVESLLIMLPTPDFSMPYNVICLSCTVIALFLGSMFNTLLNVKDPNEKDKEKEKQE